MSGSSFVTETIQPKFLSHKSHEWYTPIEIITRVHDLWGSIDLDPMSCDEAQKTVQADIYYTKDNDGLAKTWSGRVFLNPPWSGTLKYRAIEKILTDPVDEAILVLSSNSMTAKWFKPLLNYTICLPTGRPDFRSRDGLARKNPPTMGTVIVYIGHHDACFASVFSDYGTIMRRF